ALRPVPVVVVEGVATGQTPPITVRRIAINPRLRSLLQRRIEIDDVEIEGAVFPRTSVRAFCGRGEGADHPSGEWSVAPVPVARVRFSDVAWIDRREIALAYDGRIEFDADWRPRSAEVARRDVTPPARLTLAREGADADRWRTDIEVGGGSWSGTTELRTSADRRLHLHADLSPRNVDIKLLTAAFKRSAPIEGRIEGSTTVDAEGADMGELVRGLRTQTRFRVRPATLLRFDLAKAVVTAGISRGGQTPLDEFTGTLGTQATDDGLVLRYTDLKARSGVLTASGNATMMNRRIDGNAAVDLVDGVVGVPLRIGGTVDAPELSLTGGALTGAAVGSAVLPGVGTAIGARIGQKMEQMFGDGKPKPAPASKSRAAGQRSN
ncbi:MAG: AsmA-like C-terminal region-containing protein, partial [Variovorax sp.]